MDLRDWDLRRDVAAKGASECLADFSIFNIAEKLYIQITLHSKYDNVR